MPEERLRMLSDSLITTKDEYLLLVRRIREESDSRSAQLALRDLGRVTKEEIIGFAVPDTSSLAREAMRRSVQSELDPKAIKALRSIGLLDVATQVVGSLVVIYQRVLYWSEQFEQKEVLQSTEIVISRILPELAFLEADAVELADLGGAYRAELEDVKDTQEETLYLLKQLEEEMRTWLSVNENRQP